MGSTWRKLEAIRHSLESIKHKFKSKTIFWYTYNYATILIVLKGSNKPHFHNSAIDLFDNCFANNINIFWILRASNEEANKLNQEIDYGDLCITFKLVNVLCQKWSKISVDRFASDKYNKYSRFNSKFLCQKNRNCERIFIRLV